MMIAMRVLRAMMEVIVKPPCMQLSSADRRKRAEFRCAHRHFHIFCNNDDFIGNFLIL